MRYQSTVFPLNIFKVHVYATSSTNQGKGWVDADIGKRMIQNSLMNKEDVLCIIEAAKKVVGTDQVVVLKNSEEQIIFDPEHELNCEIRQKSHTSSVQFVGYGPTGLPRILYTLDDNRNSHLTNYLYKKQKELEELEYRCSVLKKFFDCAPVVMGMLRTQQDVEGFSDAEMCFSNPEAAKYALTPDQQVSLNPAGRRAWAQRCKESRL